MMSRHCFSLNLVFVRFLILCQKSPVKPTKANRSSFSDQRGTWFFQQYPNYGHSAKSVKKVCCHKKFVVKKICCQKKVCCQKKFIVIKSFMSKKVCYQKKFVVKESLLSKKFVVKKVLIINVFAKSYNFLYFFSSNYDSCFK